MNTTISLIEILEKLFDGAMARGNLSSDALSKKICSVQADCWGQAIEYARKYMGDDSVRSGEADTSVKTSDIISSATSPAKDTLTTGPLKTAANLEPESTGEAHGRMGVGGSDQGCEISVNEGLKTTSNNGFEHYQCKICGGNPTAFPYAPDPKLHSPAIGGKVGTRTTEPVASDLVMGGDSGSASLSRYEPQSGELGVDGIPPTCATSGETTPHAISADSTLPPTKQQPSERRAENGTRAQETGMSRRKQPNDCREAFEQWITSRFTNITCAKYKDGDYRAIETQQNWIGFQGAREAP